MSIGSAVMEGGQEERRSTVSRVQQSSGRRHASPRPEQTELASATMGSKERGTEHKDLPANCNASGSGQTWGSVVCEAMPAVVGEMCWGGAPRPKRRGAGNDQPSLDAGSGRSSGSGDRGPGARLVPAPEAECPPPEGPATALLELARLRKTVHRGQGREREPEDRVAAASRLAPTRRTGLPWSLGGSAAGRRRSQFFDEWPTPSQRKQRMGKVHRAATWLKDRQLKHLPTRYVGTGRREGAGRC